MADVVATMDCAVGLLSCLDNATSDLVAFIQIPEATKINIY
jgi:hypothetical protein